MIEPELSRLIKAAEIGTAPRAVSVEADAGERAALTKRFDLQSLAALAAEVSVWQDAAGIRVTGTVRGAATQTCVISAEPVPAKVDVAMDLLFAPETPPSPDDEIELDGSALDILPFDGQAVDVGEAVAQTFGLALDPYPRAKGAVVAEVRALLLSEEDAIAQRSPFAALKKP